MANAVRFDRYGPVDVLKVVEVERPVPGPGQVLVRVKAAGINLGEAKIREGLFRDRWPTPFPSGQGSDLAGVVEELGEGVERVADVVRPEDHLAFEHGVQGRTRHRGERYAPLAAGASSCQRCAAGTRPRQEIGEYIHVRRRSHMYQCFSSMESLLP